MKKQKLLSLTPLALNNPPLSQWDLPVRPACRTGRQAGRGVSFRTAGEGFKLFFVFCILYLVSCTGVAASPQVFPSPTIYGPTGLVRVPTADIVPYKNFNVGANFGTKVTTSSASVTSATYIMNLGAFNGLELGVVGGTEPNSTELREGVFVNSKLSLSSGDEPNPMLLAIGVENLFSRTQTDVYMVATKYFKQGFKLTFGFMGDFPDGRFRPLGMLGGDTNLGNNLYVAGDMLLGETLSQVNAGIKFYFNPIFSINAYGLNVLSSAVSKDSRSLLLGFSWANPF
ncbi:MAG: hypothetical protein QME05_05980 [Candidatus Margulisbacteria bacterium]|nr:hypothetical protein [Candidatus Margulisiibacteriota bacterium]